MVGLVLISHSQAVAESIKDLAHMMAPDAVIEAAGGLEDGSFGTSYERIMEAITRADQKDGVIVLMDMGSAVITAEMVLEDLGNPQVQMADAPLVEGAVAASVSAALGKDLNTIQKELQDLRNVTKF